MKKILYIINISLLISGLFNHSLVYSQTRYFLTLSNHNTRPLALGGAFFSAEDDIASINYNPGAVSLYPIDRSGKFTFFLNPILPLIAIKNHEHFGYGDTFRTGDVIDSFKYFVKAVMYTNKSVIMGILFNEESFYNIESTDKFFESKNFLHNNYNTLILNIKLARRMSFGINSNIITQVAPDGKVEERKLGTSYGILMRPGEKYMVGITYYNFPNKYSEYRKRMERICDETINAGISYKYYKNTTLYLDIRNLNEEEEKPKREIHYGLENNFFKHIAFRFGYYHAREDKYLGERDVYSFGFGLIDFNNFCKIENRFAHKNYVFNYSSVIEVFNNENIIWHFLSLNLRI